jgi:hypothetical protein
MPSRPSLAGVVEHERPIFLHVLIQPQSRRCSRKQRGKRSFAHLERIEPKAIAVEFDEIERPLENGLVMSLVFTCTLPHVSAVVPRTNSRTRSR